MLQIIKFYGALNSGLPFDQLRFRSPFKSVPNKRHLEYLHKEVKATSSVEHVDVVKGGIHGYENFAKARELAQIRSNLGNDAIPYLSTLGPHEGNIFVVMTSADGAKIWRLDWDIHKGSHINWKYKYGPGKKEYYSGSINIDNMSQDQYWEIVNRFPRNKNFIGE